MSWKPEMLIGGEWCRNALCFETKEEAESQVRGLMMRWFAPTDSRVVESTDPVNYRYVEGKLIDVEK